MDAVATFEPVSGKLLSYGANILFSSSQIPGEIVDVLIINKDKLKQFSERIQYLRTGWFQALDDIHKNPKKTMPILGQRMKLNETDTLKVYQGLKLPDLQQNHKLLQGKPEPELLKTATKLALVMLNKKLIKSPVNTEQLFGKN